MGAELSHHGHKSCAPLTSRFAPAIIIRAVDVSDRAMSAAAFVLAINLFIACVFATAFAVVGIYA
ncbi:MAG: hypothetical protein WBA73_07475, partial [Devosia sp.]